MEAVDPRSADPGELRIGQLGDQIVRVLLEQFNQQVALWHRHVLDGHPLVACQADLSICRRDNVPWSRRRDNDLRPLGIVQHVEELSGQILLRPQYTQAAMWTGADFGRVGSKEGWRGCNVEIGSACEMQR